MTSQLGSEEVHEEDFLDLDTLTSTTSSSDEEDSPRSTHGGYCDHIPLDEQGLREYHASVMNLLRYAEMDESETEDTPSLVHAPIHADTDEDETDNGSSASESVLDKSAFGSYVRNGDAFNRFVEDLADALNSAFRSTEKFIGDEHSGSDADDEDSDEDEDNNEDDNSVDDQGNNNAEDQGGYEDCDDDYLTCGSRSSSDSDEDPRTSPGPVASDVARVVRFGSYGPEHKGDLGDHPSN